MIEGQEGVTWEQWLALAQATERAGLEALFRSDHYRSILRGGDAGSLDAWALLSALAARTERIRLGTLVSPVTFRHPSVLAKCAATAQEISGGRVELGIGGGGGRRGGARARGGLVPRRARDVRLRLPAGPRADGRARRAPRGDTAPVGRGGRRVAEAVAAPARDRRRRREAADGARGGPARRRVQHGLRDGRRGAPAASDRRRRGARGGTRAADVLAHDRLRRRPRSRRGRRARTGVARGDAARLGAAGRRHRRRGRHTAARVRVGRRGARHAPAPRPRGRRDGRRPRRRRRRMRVIVVRHAEAAPGEPDDLRALTSEGREAARALGARLAPENLDAVLSSPLLRACETAAAIAAAAALEPEVDPRLAPGADVDDVLDAVAGHGDTVVVVGHQPDCGEVVFALTGRETSFPPAGTAEVEL